MAQDLKKLAGMLQEIYQPAIDEVLGRDRRILDMLDPRTKEERATALKEFRDTEASIKAAWYDLPTDPLITHIMHKHRPVFNSWEYRCTSCTGGEYDDTLEWPCPVAEDILIQLGVI